MRAWEVTRLSQVMQSNFLPSLLVVALLGNPGWVWTLLYALVRACFEVPGNLKQIG